MLQFRNQFYLYFSLNTLGATNLHIFSSSTILTSIFLSQTQSTFSRYITYWIADLILRPVPRTANNFSLHRWST